MMGLHLISCIILISCIFRASPLPLKHNIIISNTNSKNNNYGDFKSYFYPPPRQRANEVHDPTDGDGDDSITKDMMESSASNYYSPLHPHHQYQQQQQQQQQQNGDDDDYSDYASDVRAMSPENFESAKLKPSDSRKLNSTSEVILVNDGMLNGTLPSLQQQQQHQQEQVSTNSSSKFSKLLFSSPSATVTSNGPSGPFKAIICHDCENSGGVNVGHSVSFSAIKSWNVGSSNVAQKSSFNESLAKQNHQDFNVSAAAGAVEHTSEKYFDAIINGNSKTDPDAQINQNVPIENQGSAYKAESVTVNGSEQQQQQPQPPLPLNKDWNYSLLAARNENHLKANNPMSSSTSTTPEPSSSSSLSSSSSSSVVQRKPIFNDLLKVPYDVLNQPLTEATPLSLEGAIKQTQIHINHQQKFNDTITNYQHFQQFIQKSPSGAVNGEPVNHYQSTPMPEQNYEVDESVSLMTNGRAHGVQSTTPKVVNSHVVVVSEEKNENRHNLQQQQASPVHVTQHDQDAKFGVVFEGRDFRKYKVEEKTADGFIVGEYGYLSNTDGSPIFGVRYTADSNINPQLIYDALLKFLKL